MYYNWLDGQDERRAQRGEEWKEKTAVDLDANLAFPDANGANGINEFCVIAEHVKNDPRFFFAEPSGGGQGFVKRDDWVLFPSDILTSVDENNLVWAKITDSGSLKHALVVFHHWNATKRNRRLARFLSKRGITVVEMAMPYHLERSRPGSQYADFMLSANLGRTIQSVRQSVLDGRKLIRWLTCQGYQEISVLGMSLGSWVAGLIAANDTTVSKASLFLGAGSLADMVWTGRATQAIRASLSPQLELSELRRAWAPLDLENHVAGLARSELSIQFVLARRDKVVLPELSHRLIAKLRHAGSEPSVLELNCGHYTLAIPAYIAIAGFKLRRFLCG